MEKYGEIFFVSSKYFYIICTQCERTLSDYDGFINHVLKMHFKSFAFDSNINGDQNIEQNYSKIEESFHNQTLEISLIDETEIFTYDQASNNDSFETSDDIDENFEIGFEKENSNYSSSSHLNGKTQEIELEYCAEKILMQDENRNDEINEKIACKYCGELFTVENFKKHKVRRSCGKCTVCNTIVSNLFKHIQKHHKEYKAERERLKEKVVKRLPLFDDINKTWVGYPCSYCERTFTSKKYYDNHIKQHEKKSNTCKLCGKIFKLPYMLKKHLIIHTNERPYKCGVCSLAFNDDRNLKAHFINKHTEGLNLKCTFENCNKVFKTERKRKYHESYAHTGKYTKLCKECGLTFKTSGRLNDHTKNIHMKYENRQFSCSYCGKKFAFKYQLTPHEMTHTGQKPFKCALCFKEYSDRKCFKRHCQSSHESQLEICRSKNT